MDCSICKICGNSLESKFSAKILNKYNIKYFHCDKCNFLQTEEPYWLEEAYSRPINITDTGYMMRNLFYSKRISILLFLLFGNNGKYLDYAGGHGVFVRIMRDIGFDFYWDDKFAKNLFSSGFEWKEGDAVDAITAFEVFEHFVDPISEIEKLLSISKTLIFSTDLLPNKLPETEDWPYYGLEHGQHISFFSFKTLNLIAEKYGLYYFNLNSLHIFTKRKTANYFLKISRLDRFGFFNLFNFKLKSKTIEDYHKMVGVKNYENSI